MPDSRISLNHLKSGRVGTIVSVSNNPLSSKLTDMGLYPGQDVTVLFKAPLGDPMAVQVGDYTLSLRLDEAALIEVVIANED